ncbi:MAG: hypothetical protein FJZ58_01810 [Chlamydiae bacterium]|nr:hypothetical protein [Chlamydiota bacterium]
MEHTSHPVPEQKKKILILSCKGGFGHESARLSIEAMGREHYAFTTVFPIEEVSRVGPYVGANIYNTLIKNNWIRTMNLIGNKLAPLWLQAKTSEIRDRMEEFIVRYQPDLILSVIPFVNYPAVEAARKHQIPYLLVTIDNDLTNWVHGLRRVMHEELVVTIGRCHPLTRGLLRAERVQDKSIKTIGFPIHPSFHCLGDNEQIKKNLGIHVEKPIVMIMMGGAGGMGALAYVRELQQLNLPLHVIVCTGNNSVLYEKVQEVVKERKSLATFSVLQFTNAIANLMQISDLLITKPGPGTINEAIMRKLPILVDNTNSTLAWERINLDMVQDLGLGAILSKVEEVKQWVPLFLYDKKKKEEIAKTYAQMPMPAFAEHLQHILQSMLSSVCP